MSKKKAFSLGIDEKMFKAIEKWTPDEFRSTNGQIEYLLTEALRKRIVIQNSLITTLPKPTSKKSLFSNH